MWYRLLGNNTTTRPCFHPLTRPGAVEGEQDRIRTKSMRICFEAPSTSHALPLASLLEVYRHLHLTVSPPYIAGTGTSQAIFSCLCLRVRIRQHVVWTGCFQTSAATQTLTLTWPFLMPVMWQDRLFMSSEHVRPGTVTMTCSQKWLGKHSHPVSVLSRCCLLVVKWLRILRNPYFSLHFSCDLTVLMVYSNIYRVTCRDRDLLPLAHQIFDASVRSRVSASSPCSGTQASSPVSVRGSCSVSREMGKALSQLPSLAMVHARAQWNSVQR